MTFPLSRTRPLIICLAHAADRLILSQIYPHFHKKTLLVLLKRPSISLVDSKSSSDFSLRDLAYCSSSLEISSAREFCFSLESLLLLAAKEIIWPLIYALRASHTIESRTSNNLLTRNLVSSKGNKMLICQEGSINASWVRQVQKGHVKNKRSMVRYNNTLICTRPNSRN